MIHVLADAEAFNMTWEGLSMTARSTTYTFDYKASTDSTPETIEATFEYCQDFTGDGFDDVKVSFNILHDPNADLIGVAFDINNDAVSGLTVGQITANGVAGPYAALIDANRISDNPGMTDPGFNTTGGTSEEPYDIGVKFGDQGGRDGVVQTASFVISGTGDLDAEALFDGSDWWLRLQSTGVDSNGSAKIQDDPNHPIDLLPCTDEPPPEHALAQSPGFWKNHLDLFQQETHLGPDTRYESVFGVNVVGSTRPFVSSDPTLSEALGAQGGGEAALLRSSTAALANARSDDLNYFMDAAQLADAAALVGTNVTTVWSTLEKIDTDDDLHISSAEVIGAVQDVYTGGGQFAWADVGLVAFAFDTMNNMQHLDAPLFTV